MTKRQRSRAGSPVHIARIAVAGAIIAGGALSLAGPAAADPAAPYPTPGAPTPGAAAPAGQPVEAPSDGVVGPPPPPPGGAPPVPEIPNPTYGQGQTPGQLGYLRDIWHTFHTGNPLDSLTASPDEAAGPPAGAGPAPKLPPGFTSLTDPGSSTPALPQGPGPTGPPLPPGYYPLNGPPPPGYGPPPAPDAAGPPPVAAGPPPTP
jgi:hypothetical protein